MSGRVFVGVVTDRAGAALLLQHPGFEIVFSSAGSATFLDNAGQRSVPPGASGADLDDQPMELLAVTYAEAARRLGYDSTATIKRLVRAGDLRAIGSGRGQRVPVCELEAYVARQLEHQGAA